MIDQDERAAALKWWSNLSLEEQKDLAEKYKPLWTFEMVARSTMTIQIIYARESNN